MVVEGSRSAETVTGAEVATPAASRTDTPKVRDGVPAGTVNVIVYGGSESVANRSPLTVNVTSALPLLPNAVACTAIV